LPRRRRRARKALARCRRVQIPGPCPLLPYQNRSCRSPRAARSYRLGMNVGSPMRENNSAKNKRTVRHRCKIGAAAISIGAECIRKDFSAPRSGRAHSTQHADPDRRFSAVVFQIARRPASGRAGKLTTSIFHRSQARSAPITTFIVLYRPRSVFADAFGGGA